MSDQFVRALHEVDDTIDFLFGEYGRDGFGALWSKFGEACFIQSNMKDMTIEKEDCADGLILCGSGYLAFANQVGDKLIDLCFCHFFGMAFVVVQDVFPDPLHVGFACPCGVLFDQNGVAVLV